MAGLVKKEKLLLYLIQHLPIARKVTDEADHKIHWLNHAIFFLSSIFFLTKLQTLVLSTHQTFALFLHCIERSSKIDLQISLTFYNGLLSKKGKTYQELKIKVTGTKWNVPCSFGCLKTSVWLQCDSADFQVDISQDPSLNHISSKGEFPPRYKIPCSVARNAWFILLFDYFKPCRNIKSETVIMASNSFPQKRLSQTLDRVLNRSLSSITNT